MTTKTKRLLTLAALLTALLTLVLALPSAEATLDYGAYYGYDGPAPAATIDQGTCRDDESSQVNGGKHHFVIFDWLEPSCTSPGKAYYTCSYCWASLEVEFTPAMGHKWSAWQRGDMAPTCTEAGIEYRQCARCYAYEERTVAALGHKWYEWTEDFWINEDDEPTCGDTIHWYSTCSRCGEPGPETAEYLDHIWSEWAEIRPATCTTEGIKERSCQRCGEQQWQDIPALGGHLFGPWKEDEPASCNNPGMEVRSCQRCGEQEWRETPALGHQFGSWTVDTPSTCTQPGLMVRTCQRCGEQEYEILSELAAHQMGPWTVNVAPTCESQGMNVRTCQRCGHEEWEYIPALGHQWDLGKVSKSPNCTDQGEMLYTCQRDPSHTMTVPIDPLPNQHQWEEAEVIPATCDTDGVIYYVCQYNSRHTRQESISATGHEWQMSILREPTCGEDGLNEWRCILCGKFYREIIPATFEHQYGEWQIDEAATCTEQGSRHRVCQVCGYEEWQDIDPLGHDWGESVSIMPVGTLSWGKATRQCSRCDRTEERDVPPDSEPKAAVNASLWLDIDFAEDAGVDRQQGDLIPFDWVLTNTGDTPVYITRPEYCLGAEYTDESGSPAEQRPQVEYFDPAEGEEVSGVMLLPGEIYRIHDEREVTAHNIEVNYVGFICWSSYVYANERGVATEGRTNDATVQIPLTKSENDGQASLLLEVWWADDAGVGKGYIDAPVPYERRLTNTGSVPVYLEIQADISFTDAAGNPLPDRELEKFYDPEMDRNAEGYILYPGEHIHQYAEAHVMETDKMDMLLDHKCLNFFYYQDADGQWHMDVTEVEFLLIPLTPPEEAETHPAVEVKYCGDVYWKYGESPMLAATGDSYGPDDEVRMQCDLYNTGDVPLHLVLHLVYEGVVEYVYEDEGVRPVGWYDTSRFYGCDRLGDYITPGTETDDLLGTVTFSFYYVGYDPDIYINQENPGTELCRSNTVTRTWKVLREEETRDEYVILGFTAHYTTYEMTRDGYATTGFHGIQQSVWKDGVAAPYSSCEHSYYYFNTPSLGYGKWVDHEPIVGETCYFYIILTNGLRDDFSIDYSQLDPAQMDVTMDGFAVELLSIQPYDPGVGPLNAVQLVYAATYIGDGSAAQDGVPHPDLLLKVDLPDDAGVGKRYDGAVITFYETLTNTGDTVVYYYTTEPVEYLSGGGYGMVNLYDPAYEQNLDMYPLYPGDSLRERSSIELSGQFAQKPTLHFYTVQEYLYQDENGEWQAGRSNTVYSTIALTLDGEEVNASLLLDIWWADDAGVGKGYYDAPVPYERTLTNTGNVPVYVELQAPVSYTDQAGNPLPDRELMEFYDPEMDRYAEGYLLYPGEQLHKHGEAHATETDVMDMLLDQKCLNFFYYIDGDGQWQKDVTEILFLLIPLTPDASRVTLANEPSLYFAVTWASDAGVGKRHMGSSVIVRETYINTGNCDLYLPWTYGAVIDPQMPHPLEEGLDYLGYLHPLIKPGETLTYQYAWPIQDGEVAMGKIWTDLSVHAYYRDPAEEDGLGAVWANTVHIDIPLTYDVALRLNMWTAPDAGWNKRYDGAAIPIYDQLANIGLRRVYVMSHQPVTYTQGEPKGEETFFDPGGHEHLGYPLDPGDVLILPDYYYVTALDVELGCADFEESVLFHYQDDEGNWLMGDSDSVECAISLTEHDAETSLTLTAQVRDAYRKGVYQPGDYVIFDMTLTNNSDETLYYASFYINEGRMAYILIPLKPGETQTAAYGTGVYDSGDGYAHFTFDSTAMDQNNFPETYSYLVQALARGSFRSNTVKIDLLTTGASLPASESGLILTGQLRESDRKSAYQKGELVTFDVTLINDTGKDLYRTTFYKNENDQLYFLRPFCAGDSYTYDLRASVYDSGDGYAHFQIQCSGVDKPTDFVFETMEDAHAAGAILSNTLTFDLPILGADPNVFDTGLILTGELRESDQKSAYQEGESVTFDLTLVNNTGRDLYRATFFKNENDELYFLKPFYAGDTYTYDMSGLVYASDNGYAHFEIQCGGMDVPIQGTFNTLSDANGAGAILSNKLVFDLPISGPNPTVTDSGFLLTGSIREADRKESYLEGEIVTFDLTMTNATDKTLYKAACYQDGGVQVYLMVPVEPGESFPFDLLLAAHDAGDGFAHFKLECAGSEDPKADVMLTLDDALAANAVLSNQLTFDLPIAGANPVTSETGLLLTAHLDEPLKAGYKEGEGVVFQITLTNNTENSLYKIGLYRNKDKAPYLVYPLDPGEAFSYDIWGRVYDSGDGYAYFTLRCGGSIDPDTPVLHTIDEAIAADAVLSNPVYFKLPLAGVDHADSLELSGSLRDEYQKSVYQEDDRLIYDLTITNRTGKDLYRAAYYKNGDLMTYLINPLGPGKSFTYDMYAEARDAGDGTAHIEFVCVGFSEPTDKVYNTLDEALAAGAIVSNCITRDLPMAEPDADGYDVEDLYLEVVQTSEIKDVYHIDDVLTFEITLTNRGTVSYGYAENRVNRNGYTAGHMDSQMNEVIKPFLPGESKTIPFSYTVTEIDGKIGYILLQFNALGYYSKELGWPNFAPDYEWNQYDGESNAILLDLDVADGSRLLLTVEMDPASKQEEYRLGDELLFHYTLTNNGGKTLQMPGLYQSDLIKGFDTLLAPGESVSGDAVCPIEYMSDFDMGIVCLQGLAWLEEDGPVADPWPDDVYAATKIGGVNSFQEHFWFALAKDGQTDEPAKIGLQLEVNQINADRTFQEDSKVFFNVTVSNHTDGKVEQGMVTWYADGGMEGWSFPALEPGESYTLREIEKKALAGSSGDMALEWQAYAYLEGTAEPLSSLWPEDRTNIVVSNTVCTHTAIGDPMEGLGLELTVRQTSPDVPYKPYETVLFEATVTNVSDFTVEKGYIIGVHVQGYFDARPIPTLAPGESWTVSDFPLFTFNDDYEERGYLLTEWEAYAFREGMYFESEDAIPRDKDKLEYSNILYLETQISEKQEGYLWLWVEQLTPEKDVYEEGDEVTFRITVSNVEYDKPLGLTAILADVEDHGDYVSMRALYPMGEDWEDSTLGYQDHWSVEETILITWADVQAGSVTRDWVGRAWVKELYDATVNDLVGSAPGLIFSNHKTVTLNTGAASPEDAGNP